MRTGDKLQVVLMVANIMAMIWGWAWLKSIIIDRTTPHYGNPALRYHMGDLNVSNFMNAVGFITLVIGWVWLFFFKL